MSDAETTKGGVSATTQTLVFFSAMIAVYFVLVNGDARMLSARIEQGASEERAPVVPFSPGMAPVSVASIPEPIPLPPPRPPIAGKTAAAAPLAEEAILDPCIAGSEDNCRTRAMDSFYAELHRLETQKGRLVRISHFGDSVVAGPHLTPRIRARFQRRFGDGGAGFVNFGNPSRWYSFSGVRHASSKGWSVRSVGKQIQAEDALYGIGGVSYTGKRKGRSASFQTTKETLGSRVSSFELYFLEQPKGGKMELSVDGKSVALVDSSSDSKKSAYYRASVPQGPHELEVTLSGGTVRNYGVVMEGDEGVVYDNLGVVGLTVQSLSRRMGAAHWIEQVSHRAADLSIVTLAVNDVTYLQNTETGLTRHQVAMTEVLRRLRKARPKASCLVIGPPDVGERIDGKVRSKAVIPGMVEAQKTAALAMGCAFWDTHQFMGGPGSAQKWRRASLIWQDYSHPTEAGGAKIGDGFYDAIMDGYAKYKATRR